jgi:hypothetical protein
MMFIAACLGIAQDSVLHIKVLAGDGANYALGAHAKPLTVEVTDATGRPVAGARVSFQVPEEGPGGQFPNGLRTDIAITDSNGHATGHGLQLNRTAGSFAIRITAAKEQARAGTIARGVIGNSDAQLESADRKAQPSPPAARQPEPAPAPAPQRPSTPPPAITMPGTTATGPVKVAAAQPPPPAAQSVRTIAEPPQGVPTIIVTQKSAKSVAEIGADGGHRSHKKWLWIALIAAGGAGAAFAASSLASHSGAGAATAAGLSSPAVSIGTPTITIGKP